MKRRSFLAGLIAAPIVAKLPPVPVALDPVASEFLTLAEPRSAALGVESFMAAVGQIVKFHAATATWRPVEGDIREGDAIGIYLGDNRIARAADAPSQAAPSYLSINPITSSS